MDTYESNMQWLVDTDGHDWEFGPLGYGHADDCRTCECDRMGSGGPGPGIHG